MILPVFRMMTSMYTVTMNVVISNDSVSIAYHDFARDSDLDNYSEIGPM